MEKLKEKINVQNIIMMWILLQPVIDIITALSIEYLHLTITFGIIIRTIFMGFCVILGIVKANKKYRIGMCIYYGVLFTYMIGFLVNHYLENGTNLLFLQIKGLIKNFYLPILLVALIPIFKEYKIDVSKKVLTIALMVYVVTIFICSICAIGFLTYKAGDKSGTVGLFYSANEIGAILCLLSPFFVTDFAKRKLKIKDWIFLFLLIYAVLQLGTKVPYFGFMILMGTLFFMCLIGGKIYQKKDLYQKAGLFFSFFNIIYLVTGLTPVGENLTRIYGDVFVVTQADIKSGFSREKTITEFKNLDELKETSVSGRNDFLKANKEKFIGGSLQNKLIGIGFVDYENGQYEELKLTEMDYYDILFCNGIIGIILFGLPILIFLISFMRYTILHKKKIGIELIYSIVMAGIVALLAGHVFVSPAVSIYIVMILLKYDLEIRQENQEKVGEEK